MVKKKNDIATGMESAMEAIEIARGEYESAKLKSVSSMILVAIRNLSEAGIALMARIEMEEVQREIERLRSAK